MLNHSSININKTSKMHQIVYFKDEFVKISTGLGHSSSKLRLFCAQRSHPCCRYPLKTPWNHHILLSEIPLKSLEFHGCTNKWLQIGVSWRKLILFDTFFQQFWYFFSRNFYTFFGVKSRVAALQQVWHFYEWVFITWPEIILHTWLKWLLHLIKILFTQFTSSGVFHNKNIFL